MKATDLYADGPAAGAKAKILLTDMKRKYFTLMLEVKNALFKKLL